MISDKILFFGKLSLTYFQNNLNLWDIAAGILLVREAGGFVSDFASRDQGLGSGNIVAANQAIHAELLKTLNRSAGKTL